jgi:hypothetical protein
VTPSKRDIENRVNDLEDDADTDADGVDADLRKPTSTKNASSGALMLGKN